MTLPLINQFLFPFEIWQTRSPTQHDIAQRLENGWPIPLCMQPVNIIQLDKVDTADKAVKYISDGRYNNQIENCIERSLNDIKSFYSHARQFMPRTTPDILSQYQRLYSSRIDMLKVDDALNSGGILANNQILFHGGGIVSSTSVGDTYTINRPLSTSLCPVKAFSVGLFDGKYYNQDQVNLVILTVKNITKKAFIFRINGTNKGHEKEVLLSTGTKLEVTSKSTLVQNFTVYGMDKINMRALQKQVSFIVTHATIS